jgi:hypothetical protein
MKREPAPVSPADVLREEIYRALRASPFFVSKALGRIPAELVTWIESVEARLLALEKRTGEGSDG